MKLTLLILAQAMALAAFAAGPPFGGDYYKPFDGKDCEIIWDAATNQSPSLIKIWKVIPTKFSPSTVSNLLQIAGLKPSQHKRVDQDGVFAGKDVRFFGDRNDTRQLNLIPSQGFIVISRLDTRAQIPKELPSGVPDPKTALQLTLEILEKIGISQSELATNSDGKLQAGYTQGEVLHKDKRTGLVVTNIDERQIFLKRQIEGIPVTGSTDGVTAHFGNEGKVGYLSVVWRAINPERECPVPDATGFINQIKSGRVLIPAWAQGGYKKLTITKVSFNYWENSGSEPQSHIYPFAVLEAKTDQPGENSNVQLFIPFADE
jgi:hypothetical protein